ncbi:hypothetical protein K469DRAFT_740325 [Zopfia rhizophila CBS 207.26]|uniref:Uncharacterized protein n=1 Tax=Zopfia rhizophila CBS 207.26 TaxID=1314779 RepID=A0A6A6DTR0_9PEZI|nr:hypothetical protein K469DRAFT_740325 [Zopfia rhizophila CBS 207.26]
MCKIPANLPWGPTSLLYSAYRNPYPSGLEKRPRGPRSTPKIELASNPDVILPRSPFNLQTEAVVCPNALRSVLDDLLPAWTSRAECQILNLAISSIALAVFSRTQQYPPAAVEASIRYQQLLQVLQITLPSLDQGNIEACLLAIIFMSPYEDSTLQSSPHQDGALAILKFWKEHLSPRQPATNVIKHSRRAAINSALIRNLALPEWMKEGASFGEHGLEVKYDGIITRIATETLKEEARGIDRALQDGATHFPSMCCYRRHTLSNPIFWPKKHFYSPIVYSHQSLAYAAVWIPYYSTRMLINSTRLSVLQLSEANLDSFSHEQRLECLSHIKAMADDRASTLPFCLERFKITDGPGSSNQNITLDTNENIKPYLAGLIISPLTIASSISHGDVE